MNLLVNDVLQLSPELILVFSALSLLLWGAFFKKNAVHTIQIACLMLVVCVCVLIFFPGLRMGQVSFGSALIHDAYTAYVKIILYLASALALILSRHYINREMPERFEYPVLILLSVIGMSIMVSSASFLTLYMGLELQSLALYVLVAFNRDSERATEAGLKYFVLGALSSGLLLYGISLIYGFSASISFSVVAESLHQARPIGTVIGLVFILSALVFKISAAPFHMWTPDVYEGAPTPVTAFLATASKFAGIAILARVLIVPFADLKHDWQQIIVVLAVITLFWGSFAALTQKNIKRLMAYSSITNIGYALVALASGTQEGLKGVLVFSSVYTLSVIGVFSIVLAMRRKDGMVENIEDLAGLSKTNPFMCVSLTLLLFSMIGMPPLAGFFAKVFALLPAIKAGFMPLVVLALIASAVSAYYYLKIIKVMWFDETSIPFIRTERSLTLVMLVTVILVSLFFLNSLFYTPVGVWLEQAGQALF